VIVGRYLGVAMLVLGLLCGLAILYGAYGSGYEAGLLRTWAAFGGLYVLGLLTASVFSGVRGSERVVRRAGAALLGLGVVAGGSLALSAVGILSLSDTMQPWALLAVCAVAGCVILFGSSA
jgi:hypothetical protein